MSNNPGVSIIRIRYNGFNLSQTARFRLDTVRLSYLIERFSTPKTMQR
jgi:hypothetical protein